MEAEKANKSLRDERKKLAEELALEGGEDANSESSED